MIMDTVLFIFFRFAYSVKQKNILPKNEINVKFDEKYIEIFPVMTLGNAAIRFIQFS